MRRGWRFVWIGVLGIGVLGGGAAMYYKLTRSAGPTGPATAYVARRDLTAAVTATGTIKAMVGAEVKVGSRIPGRVDAAAAQVGALLRERHRIRAGRPDDFTIQSQAEILEAAQETSGTFTLLLGSVAGISLFVGGIGILAMMVISVRERTKEIGVRRAVGARRRDILAQFILEAASLSLAGGLIGVVVGLGGGVAIGRVTGWPTAVSPMAVLLAVGISALVGIFFGAYPARRAALLDPIEALRAE